MKTRLFESTLYKITALSNLHVGNGEANFSVLDKQVQRDVISNYPQINASSLKGALREYMTFVKFKKEEGKDSFRPLVSTIFGSKPTHDDEKSEKNESKSSESVHDDKAHQGYMNFHDAKLLSLPVRTNKTPFLRATSKEVLNAYIDYCEMFGIAVAFSKDDVRTWSTGYSGEDWGEIMAEDWTYSHQSCLDALEKLLGADAVILMEDEEFRALAKELPFVARNYLENGKSENLWYEEIVPRESQFYFVVEQPSDNTLAYKLTQESLSKDARKLVKKDKVVTDYFEDFNTALSESELFIGANTTVGYGKCKIVKLHTTTKTEEASDEPKED